MFFFLFTLLVIMVLAGAVVALVNVLRGSSGADEILRDRLARGELTPDEFRERLEVLGSSGRKRWSPGWVALALIVIGVVGILLLGLVPGGMMGWMMDDPMMRGGMMGGETERSGPAPSARAREVRVEAGELYFRPAEVRIRVGERVNLVLENQGHMFHTLTVPGAKIDLRARPGDEISAAFEGERPGRYEFLCTVPGHAEGGMRGAVVVEVEQ